MTTQRAVFSTEPDEIRAPQHGRRALEFGLQAVVICGLVASTGVSLAARNLCDDPDHPADEQGGAAPRFRLSVQQFDQMIFGGAQRVVVENGQRKVISGPSSSGSFLKQMETLLENEIGTVDARCRLSEAQKNKLQLAGKGDIARWLSRVAELRNKYTAVEMDQLQHERIVMELQSLRMVPQSGAFGDTSLFRKTLRKTLTDEQLGPFQAMVRERTVLSIQGVLGTLEANGRMKLPAESRTKFIEILVEHGTIPQTNSPYFQYIVWFEAGRLQDQLIPLLNESQRLAFEQQVSNAKRAEPILRQRGLWPVAAPEDDEVPSNGQQE